MPLSQALVGGPRGMLDHMEFRCPDSVEVQALYFDYSADPMESAFEQQVEAAQKK